MSLAVRFMQDMTSKPKANYNIVIFLIVTSVWGVAGQTQPVSFMPLPRAAVGTARMKGNDLVIPWSF